MTQPQWLDDDEQRTWRAYLWGSRLLFDALDRQLQRDAGMPHAYYMILVALSEAPGRTMRMTELAAVTGSSPSRVSHAVARLEENGWVCRSPYASDRRGALASLTDTGMAVLRAAAPGHVDAVRRQVFDRLTPEQVAQLREISGAIVGHGGS